MKNMPVGRKILFGFMSVVILIVVILAVTVVTSLMRNNDLNNTNTMADLQREANTMMNEVNEARIELRTVYTSSGDAAMEAYEKAIPLLESARGRIAALDAYDSELSTLDMSGVNDQLEQYFDQLIPLVEQVHQNDITVQENNAVMQEASRAMHDEAEQLAHILDELVVEVSAGDAAALATRIAEIVTPAQDILDDINEMRVTSAPLMLNNDLSVVADIDAALTSVESQLDALYAKLTTDEARAAVDELRAQIATYRTTSAALEELIAHSNTTADEARDAVAQLAALVDEGVSSLGDQSDAMIVATTNTSMTVMIIMTVIVVIAAAFAVFMSFYLGRAITRPLNMMKEVLVQAGTTGNLTFEPEVIAGVKKEAEARDEIGQSLGAFAGMMDRMIFIGDKLTEVADGDLTADITLLSDEDTMGTALKQMSDHLNDMFAEIQSVSSQVSTASGEIAQGAQSLAQGSTEQASTVEEISASINEITSQASVSVETASTAAHESESIRAIAQEGNQKMDRLAEAVQQMNDASQSIGKVIKVIDDIAFQTNILALNAAVEAARAGQHGKGFAVVADEVRSLAGKSADAAKETADLISASMEKAEYGLDLSRETAETLAQIVEGVEKTTGSLITISDQSNGSKAATEQVNMAVDQVAQVVQQNSATSEESAAASEEMSSQAQVLQQLVARFKLRGGGHYAAPRIEQASVVQADYAPPHASGDVLF